MRNAGRWVARNIHRDQNRQMDISLVTVAPTVIEMPQMWGMETDEGIALGCDDLDGGLTVASTDRSVGHWFMAFDSMLARLEFFGRYGAWRKA